MKKYLFSVGYFVLLFYYISIATSLLNLKDFKLSEFFIILICFFGLVGLKSKKSYVFFLLIVLLDQFINLYVAFTDVSYKNNWSDFRYYVNVGVFVFTIIFSLVMLGSYFDVWNNPKFDQNSIDKFYVGFLVLLAYYIFITIYAVISGQFELRFLLSHLAAFIGILGFRFEKIIMYFFAILILENIKNIYLYVHYEVSYSARVGDVSYYFDIGLFISIVFFSVFAILHFFKLTNEGSNLF
jgi:hypothetical protein